MVYARARHNHQLTRHESDKQGGPPLPVGDAINIESLGQRAARKRPDKREWQLGCRLMAVKARLSGHAFDLDALERLLVEGADPQIGHDAEGYFLTSPELEPLFDDGGTLSEAASQLASWWPPLRRLKSESKHCRSPQSST